MRVTVHLDTGQSDMEIYCLGKIAVGRVMYTGGRGNRPRYYFDLARPFPNWRTARTEEHARAALQAEIYDWVTRAELRT